MVVKVVANERLSLMLHREAGPCKLLWREKAVEAQMNSSSSAVNSEWVEGGQERTGPSGAPSDNRAVGPAGSRSFQDPAAACGPMQLVPTQTLRQPDTAKWPHWACRAVHMFLL